MKKSPARKQLVDKNTRARELVRARELERIRTLLDGFDGWWPGFALRHPDQNRQDIISALVQQEARLQKEHDARVPRRAGGTPRSIGSRAPNAPFWAGTGPGSSGGKIAWPTKFRAPFPTSSCLALSGTVLPSDFCNYVETPGNTPPQSVVFVPEGMANPRDPGTDPFTTYAGNWAGATGMDFMGFFSSSDGFPFFTQQYAWSVGVLQITFPAPTCDSTLAYFTDGIIAVPTGGKIDDIGLGWGHYGNLWVDYYLFESPEGGAFPGVDQYATAPGFNIDKTSNWSIWVQQPFQSQFAVKAGVQSRIYVGIGVMLTAAGALVQTGAQHYPEVGYFDLRVPESIPEQHPFNGVYYTITPNA
jgi:hypothetical protein